MRGAVNLYKAPEVDARRRAQFAIVWKQERLIVFGLDCGAWQSAKLGVKGRGCTRHDLVLTFFFLVL
jgi:hypothetical protein